MKFRMIMNKEVNRSNTHHKKQSRLVLVLFLMLFIFVLSSCAKEPIKVGFIGHLSSKNSQLAIDARNAVELAVRITNENGGVDGREIELIMKDDKASTEEALIKHNEFKEEGVKFVIGHLNSNMATAIEESAGNDLLFISPSMSTTVLSEKDDFFLRSSPVNSNQAILFAQYALEKELDDLVIIYDLMNEQYTKTVAKKVEEVLEINDQPIKDIITYDSRTDELVDIARKIEQSEPKNIFVIAQATDTAYLIQNLKQSNEDLGTYSVSWSMTKDLIENGGENVEGTRFVGLYVPEELSPEYNEFAYEFEDNYGYELSFIGVLGYDALTVLIKGIEYADKIDPESVKNSIIKISEFEGLYNDFNIDMYGDNDKEYMMYELYLGEFLPLRDWMD